MVGCFRLDEVFAGKPGLVLAASQVDGILVAGIWLPVSWRGLKNAAAKTHRMSCHEISQAQARAVREGREFEFAGRAPAPWIDDERMAIFSLPTSLEPARAMARCGLPSIQGARRSLTPTFHPIGRTTP